MKRAERYRGWRPRSGLTAGQVAAMALITLAALLVMTMKVSAQWCGDAVKMCQVVDLRMKSQRGADPAEELKLLLARLGAARK